VILKSYWRQLTKHQGVKILQIEVQIIEKYQINTLSVMKKNYIFAAQ